MNSLLFWVGIGAIILIFAVGIEAYLRRNRPKRNLSEYFGATENEATETKPELGTEEIDMDQFRADMQMNRTIEDRNRYAQKGAAKIKPQSK
ncbi:hypothetical protein GCM10008927_00170 [Amylibacter ulvae]|uniref:Uncharacterized protein n=1 Tax=Paramylibacter ulvae TaxID=1651968 RepID=A0ABQ3CSY4_9RHOB|nr:hypothetical protein [Amylibacter ulvae]GHA40058.1 hypothetical protein GCM10008927_00170 [Amylibacter ulvae]